MFPLEQKIGQLLFIGLPGPTLDADSQQLIKAIQPGGVILFARNLESPQQTAELNADIRRFSRVMPLVSIDQEGGRVDRLRQMAGPMPSAKQIAKADDAKLAFELGVVTADLLRPLGFNMNFAPVLDLDVAGDRPNGLEERCWGMSPLTVIRFAGTYLEGLQNHGILGCGKHFPGLGDTTVDSHHVLPTVERSEKQLLAEDLRVYSDLFGTLYTRVPAVMIAHASYPAFDGHGGIPASLSRNIVTDLLRKRMEFSGIAICDDLEMGAIQKTIEFSEAVVRAIEAGNDMLLVCSRPDLIREAQSALVRAVESGRIPRPRLEASIDRIAKIKAMVMAPQPYSAEAFRRATERLAAIHRAVGEASTLQESFL
ncbi:MAG: beta-N-acetylhexosaminidase [Chloracidobacterium sp.]|uniref:Beta-N-acetylhexosaminidase n=1 Tax=Chloracidobacterium validum TaxID=2821543 RepID=A0ABX8BBY0_9BACT|nr:beta-N-acetylhexosaminidase [Chloracidobacterium validum]QUW03148.1 beta-N-acetylhexosaminidase [Chloracidobacterium validum]